MKGHDAVFHFWRFIIQVSFSCFVAFNKFPLLRPRHFRLTGNEFLGYVKIIDTFLITYLGNVKENAERNLQKCNFASYFTWV